ncbi:MAG: hypothetical protein LBV12_04770 [Puniceicoccales bacterium]|jgi:hypothetical protein|nr:hypothetical protein [Puniceicoccales bacterium]
MKTRKLCVYIVGGFLCVFLFIIIAVSSLLRWHSEKELLSAELGPRTEAFAALFSNSDLEQLDLGSIKQVDAMNPGSRWRLSSVGYGHTIFDVDQGTNREVFLSGFFLFSDEPWVKNFGKATLFSGEEVSICMMKFYVINKGKEYECSVVYIEIPEVKKATGATEHNNAVK